MSAKASKAPRNWPRLSRERLLELRICDLGLRIEGSPLGAPLKQLYRELEQNALRFRPHVWLSDEWFCPDDIPGFAIPFFLAHARLRRLEREFMLEVEGGDRAWCLKLMRHETGHALLNAYRLDQRRDWKQAFGRPSTPYPDTYLPRPYSKRYVRNLPNWYAQSHPHEDWAETFAVWLNPRSDWRRRYRNWPALKKLHYVDALMNEIHDRPPRLRNRQTDTPVEKIRTTLREYYDDKIYRYGLDSPEFSDTDLTQLFSAESGYRHNEKASRYIRRHRRELISIVERWTHEYRYRINEVINSMIKRCDEMKLHVIGSNEETRPELAACLTMLVMSKLHSGGFHIAL